MASTLTVRKVINIDLDKFKQDFITLKKQTTLDEYDFEQFNLGFPKTIIKKRFTQGNFHYYKVSMNSKTIEEPIFVYWDELENKGFKEVNTGYQKVINFNFCFNKDYTKIYIFNPKEVAGLFLRRLKKEGLLECEKIKFNFKNITELRHMDSAWGVWEDHKGIERKRARFGKNINTIFTDDEYETISTIYMDYDYSGDLVQIILNKDGRLSSKMLSEEDLRVLHEEITDTLMD